LGCKSHFLLKEVRNAKNEDEPWSGQKVQNHRVREDRQKQGVFKSYSYKKEHKKKKEAPEIISGAFCKHKTGIQTYPLPLGDQRGIGNFTYK
jgi:hypothetical protein